MWYLIVSIPDLCPPSYFSYVPCSPLLSLFLCSPQNLAFVPSSPEINVLIPLFPQTPGRASVICRLPCENRHLSSTTFIYLPNRCEHKNKKSWLNRITKIQQVLTSGGKNRETLHVTHVAQEISRAISAAAKTET